MDPARGGGKDLNRESDQAGGRLGYKGRYSNIGLDLGSSRIKFIQFRGNRGRIQVHRYGIYWLPGGTIEGGRIVDPVLLASRLRWFLNRRSLYKNRVNLSISRQSVILRQIFLPPMSSRELADAVRWEAKKQVMVPLDQVVLDYLSLGERRVGERQLIEVVLVSVPKEVVEGYIRAITGAGFYPAAIEIEPFALQRSLYYLQEPFRHREGAGLLMLDLGSESSTLLVLEGGRYSFSRTIPVGVNHFCRHLVEKGGMDKEMALRLILRGDPGSQVGVMEVAGELAAQIKKTMDYYAHELGHSGKTFTRLFYCGGGAGIKGLWPFLERALGIAPRLFNPLTFLSQERRLLCSPLQAEGDLLAVAQGLALRGWVT